MSALAQRRLAGGEVDPVGRERDGPALRIAEGEAVLGDLRLQPLAPQEGDVEAGGEPGAADIAADRAGAVDDDMGQPRPR